jgi:hypothetical protein
MKRKFILLFVSVQIICSSCFKQQLKDYNISSDLRSPIDCNLALYHQAVSDGLKLNDSIELIDSEGREILLRSIHTDTSSLILIRYNSKMCSTCLDLIGSYLKKDEFLFHRTVLITDEMDPSILKYYMYSRKIAARCYGSYVFSLPADFVQEPYVLICDHNNCIHSLLFPAHLPDTIIDNYLNFLKARLVNRFCSTKYQ